MRGRSTSSRASMYDLIQGFVIEILNCQIVDLSRSDESRTEQIYTRTRSAETIHWLFHGVTFNHFEDAVLKRSCILIET